MRTTVSIAFILLTCLEALSAQTAGRPRVEQTAFSAEDETVKRPIVLSDDALRVIKEDPHVAEALKNQEPPATKIPRGWLSASEIHLAGPDEKDIIVVATRLLRGANVTTFWALRPSSRGYELLLTAPAHDLVIRRTRFRGYKGIELFSASAVEVSTVSLRFDGMQYTLHGRSSQPIR